MDINQQQQQQQLRVSLKDAEDVKCDECQSIYFSAVAAIKRLSALMSPSGKEVMVPVQTFQCVNCGYVNEEFKQIK
jgi:hypothetical protein